MSEIKVRLSLELPGSTMLSEQECSANSKVEEKKKDYYGYFNLKVASGKGKKSKETLNIAVRKSRTARQNIKLSREAYDYMTDKELCPSPKLKKEWSKFTVNQRLQYHCRQIAEALGAIDFSFEILED